MIRSVDYDRDSECAPSRLGRLASPGFLAAAARVFLFSVVAMLTVGASVFAQEGAIAPGTVITLKNWQNYRQFMPEGMQALFKGDYHWAFPPDFQMVVGPTHSYPLPAAYRENTERYSKNVKIRTLPNGGLTIDGYVAGQPFPNPEAPQKGWKILVDLWYSYVPYLICGFQDFWLVDRFNNVSFEQGVQVYRRLTHISDAGQPIVDPLAQGVDYSEYIELVLPEQSRYLANLTFYYDDLTKPEDTFLFIPALRRSLRLSSSARCSPIIGTDYAQDDARNGDFNGGITKFQAKWLRDQNILVLTTADVENWNKLENLYPQVFFPSPKIGKWEVRNQYVIDVRRIPALAAGYCYGKKIIYLDKASFLGSWTDIYDTSMRLWKAAPVENLAREVPGEGMQMAGNNILITMYDMQNNHLTSSMLKPGHNQQCKSYQGVDYTDVHRYSSVTGLSQIMR
ncbi:MAG: DUF1329 domain-containing protein [Candidatus Binataceae bacterium]|nr:DUF1329 domain-containing protein [Candidatus Binataceae bacterium]